MGRTLRNLLVTTGVALAVNGKPCCATPSHPEYLQEPNVVSSQVEPGYTAKTSVLTTVITAIASGLTGFTLGYFLNWRKNN